MTEQMKIFRKMLDDRDIKWKDASEENSVLPITRTHFLYNDIEWSVIHGFGTYGGWNHHESDKGLLEIWDHDSEPIGWLTAKEAMDTITDECMKETNHER